MFELFSASVVFGLDDDRRIGESNETERGRLFRLNGKFFNGLNGSKLLHKTIFAPLLTLEAPASSFLLLSFGFSVAFVMLEFAE